MWRFREPPAARGLADRPLVGRVELPDGVHLVAEEVDPEGQRAARRAGAGLDAPAKERLKEIGDRLASLGTTFGQNVLADEQSYVMPLGEDDLAGLPDFARAAARGAADERGLKGQYSVTLGRSSVEPFLQFSARGSRGATAAPKPTTTASSPS